MGTRPSSLKQADKNNVARDPHFCIGGDSQRGVIFGSPLAQSAVDLDCKAHSDACDVGGGQLLEFIHTSSVGTVGSLPCLLLCNFASACLSVAHSAI